MSAHIFSLIGLVRAGIGQIIWPVRSTMLTTTVQCSLRISGGVLLSHDGLHDVSEASTRMKYSRLKSMILFLYEMVMCEDNGEDNEFCNKAARIFLVFSTNYRLSNQMNVDTLWIRQYWHNSTGPVSLCVKCLCPRLDTVMTGTLVCSSIPGWLHWSSDDGLLPCLRVWTPIAVRSTSPNNQWWDMGLALFG